MSHCITMNTLSFSTFWYKNTNILHFTKKGMHTPTGDNVGQLSSVSIQLDAVVHFIVSDWIFKRKHTHTHSKSNCMQARPSMLLRCYFRAGGNYGSCGSNWSHLPLSHFKLSRSKLNTKVGLRNMAPFTASHLNVIPLWNTQSIKLTTIICETNFTIQQDQNMICLTTLNIII